jgi:methylenetetrahydrofolate dehydrogenase (NADP+) / methenyltetrahydrofolate cyclohydrolase
METQRLSGKIISQKIKTAVHDSVLTLPSKPGLAVVTVGDDPASKVYVKNKEEACREVGIVWKQVSLSDKVTEEELFSVVTRLNLDPEIHGILVQVPFPPNLSYLESAIVDAIDPKKDVDAFHPFNVGKFLSCKGAACDTLLLPPTPYGIIRLLEEYSIPISGKHVVILGRSNLVGKPLSLLMLARDATVTICHTKTHDVKEIAKQADILIVAIGKPHSVDATFIKEGAVVVDVGINWSEAGVVGDVDETSVGGIASALTPVPGGVGRMTIAILLENVLKAYHMQMNSS